MSPAQRRRDPGFGRRCRTQPQLEAWAGCQRVESHRSMTQDTFTRIAVTREEVVALEPVGSLVAGKVDRLFANPRRGGGGVTRQLLAVLEDVARGSVSVGE